MAENNSPARAGEIVGQVGEKMLDGLSFEEAADLSQINWKNVGIEAGLGFVTGAFTGGADKITKFITNPTLRKITTELLEYGLDAVIEGINSILKDLVNEGVAVIDKDYFYQVLRDVGFSTLGGELAPKLNLDSGASSKLKRLEQLQKRESATPKQIEKYEKQSKQLEKNLILEGIFNNILPSASGKASEKAGAKVAPSDSEKEEEKKKKDVPRA